MTANKDATWSTSGAQVLHIVLIFSDHYAKGKVFSFVVGGAPELLAAEKLPHRNRVTYFAKCADHITNKNYVLLRKRLCSRATFNFDHASV